MRYVRRVKVAGSIFAAWTVYGFLLGQQVYALRSGDSLTWKHALAFELAYCYAWAALTPFILRLRKAFPVDGSHWKRTVPVHVVVGLLAAAAAQTGENLILIALHVKWFPVPPIGLVLRSIFSTLDYGVVLYAVVVLLGQTFAYWRQHHLDELQKAALQSQLAEAQLKALRMQMHPHFLFNVLNSVSALIHDDPDAADRLVARLSELLRLFLNTSETSEVQLDQEVAFLERYLAIQKIRFEERLVVEIALDPRTCKAFVPSFLLQPLVENAIRHGISEREDAGLIEIQSCLEFGRVQLRVADNGDGRSNGERVFAPDGTGIRNTRRRLETIYGRDFQFLVEHQSLGGVQALISIPYRCAVEEG